MRLRMDSSDFDTQTANQGNMFGRRRTLHSMFGGGKVADILLWENKPLSAAILMATTVTWFLVEFMDYSFVTLLCHSLILTMLAISLSYKLAGLVNWNPPNKHDLELPKSTTDYFFAKINWALLKFYDVSCGKDFKLLTMAIAFLWTLSSVGTYVSYSNLLYLGKKLIGRNFFLGGENGASGVIFLFHHLMYSLNQKWLQKGCLCVEILPALYQRYEKQVDELATQGKKGITKLYKKLETRIFDKIPRAVPERSF